MLKPQTNSPQSLPVHNGTVITWVESQGFGFVCDEETGDNIFLHFRNWTGIGAPQPGDYVRYTFVNTRRGRRAITCGPAQPGGAK
jgi:cold shock CspA family protein